MQKFDPNVLYLLSENGRMKMQELARQVRKSPQSLRYTLATLQRTGVLRDPYCIVDYSYFGLLLFRVYFRGGYVSEEEKKQAIAQLTATPSCLSVVELTGEYDLAAEFAAPNPSRFNKEFKRLTTATPALNNYKIILNLVTHVYARHYLVKSQRLQGLCGERIVGGDRDRETFTGNELAVLRALASHPTRGLTALASITGLNVRTVKSVMHSLVRRNIIKGFKYVLDTNAIGVTKSRLFLRLHNVSLERESQLMRHTLGTREVVQVNKTVGDWDMEIDIESFDKNRVRTLIQDLRQQFKDLVQGFNLIDVYRYHKRSYLPAFLFQDAREAPVGKGPEA